MGDELLTFFCILGVKYAEGKPIKGESKYFKKIHIQLGVSSATNRS